MVKLDPNLPERTDFENIQKGDVIFDVCTGGLGSGGYHYGNGYRVTNITEDAFSEGERVFSKETGEALSPPWAYKVKCFQRLKELNYE